MGVLMSVLKKELETLLPEVEQLIIEKSEEVAHLVWAWAKDKLGLLDEPEETKQGEDDVSKSN